MAYAPGHPGGSEDQPAVYFRNTDEFWAWLERFHDTETHLWMELRKRHVADRGLIWEDAVPIALCWGWIDSKLERIDEDAVRQRWTPRKSSSNWSRINIDLVENLRAQGRMQPSGLAAYENRRPSRPYSYEQPASDFTPDHAALMATSAPATAFWAETTASYRKICAAWVAGATQQVTRDKRMAQLIEDHSAGRLIPSQRYGVRPRWSERAAAAAEAASTD